MEGGGGGHVIMSGRPTPEGGAAEEGFLFVGRGATSTSVRKYGEKGHRGPPGVMLG